MTVTEDCTTKRQFSPLGEKIRDSVTVIKYQGGIPTTFKLDVSHRKFHILLKYIMHSSQQEIDYYTFVSNCFLREKQMHK